MPGLKTSQKEHKAMGNAVLQALRAAREPLTFDQLVEAVKGRVPAELFPTREKVAWYAKAVQLDMEHQGKIERLEKPLRFRVPSGPQRTLRQVYNVKASPGAMWQMLTDPQKIQSWSGAPAVMDAAAGTKFSLWDGSICGENVEVVPERRLVQLWREREWRRPSKVTFHLRKKEEGVTTIELVHEGIPRERLQDISRGWDAYYLGAIKRHFG